MPTSQIEEAAMTGAPTGATHLCEFGGVPLCWGGDSFNPGRRSTVFIDLATCTRCLQKAAALTLCGVKFATSRTPKEYS